MLIIKKSMETRASIEDIWHVWQDVKNWKKWDADIEYSELHGPFEVGTKGILKPKNGPLVKTILTSVVPKKSFVDEANLLCAQIIVTHSMTKIDDSKNLVSHQIEMKGPLAFFFAFVIGRTMKKNLEITMKLMIEQAELLSGTHYE